MEADRTTQPLRARAAVHLQEARAGLAYLPVLRTRPGLVQPWLLGTRSARLLALGALVLGLWLMPWLRDLLVGLVFPDQTSSGFLGLGRRVRVDPRADTARTVLNVLYGLLAAVAVGVELLRALPAVCAEGGSGAKARPGPAGPGRVSATGATLAGSPVRPEEVAEGIASAVPPQPHDTAVRYTSEAELGAGGMGVVHRARDRVLGRPVALKRLYPELASNRELAARFLREARVLAHLSHPHIVPVFDAGEDAEGMWMAMELLPDGSLADLLGDGDLPYAHALQLGVQLADAMAYAHAQGVVHRDFKPDNVLMQGPRHVKVTDFGLARLVLDGGDHKLTQPGAVMGSPAYMSPEQASGGVADARSDIYALGATLFELVSGRPPFDGDSASAVLIKHLTEVPQLPEPLRAALPGGFVVLLARMLEKKPEDRPQQMGEVAAALRGLQG